MAHSAAALLPIARMKFERVLLWAIGAVVAAHLIVLLVPGSHGADASRACTAVTVALASACLLARVYLLPGRERPSWFWAATGMLLWGIAHATELFVSHSAAASNLTVDSSDFIYVASIFPLLVAFSTTRELQALRAVFLFNCAQVALACFLSYELLYRMAMTPTAAETVMGKIYGAACVLLAVMSLLRSFTWATQEERCCFHWISIFLWTYLPIEVGMDYATQYHGLKAGTLLDLLWSVPFVLAGWKAITLPIDETRPEEPNAALRRPIRQSRLLAECLCPLLINAGIFALAAAVIQQHLLLGLAAIFALLLIQGVQAALVQMSYLTGRNLLLDREHDLQVANAALEKLTLLDPLTSLANRRKFDTELETAWRCAVRDLRPISLLVVDVDYFKGVNDHHGHAYGDNCLIQIASVFSRQIHRGNDLAARLGGEEFALLLPETDERGAESIANRVRDAVRTLRITNAASPYGRILTISVGAATCLPSALRLHTAPTVLFEAADKALYQAKALGRNCTCTDTLR
jgi:diguanylate cyclase (GGDEF)-like protein